MKQKIQILFAFIISLVLLTSCIYNGPTVRGNGNVVEENRKTGSFDEIKVSRGMNVYISHGDFTKLKVKADENLLKYIETEVEGNTLIIRSSANIRKATVKKVFVTVSDLSKIKATSGSNVFSETELHYSNLDLSCTSGSNMKLDVKAENLEVSATSGSNIKLEGTSRNITGSSTSGANIKAEGLNTKNATVKVSSGANFWISVKNSIDASASSGGNIFYYGDPKSNNINKSSGGNIIKK